jgi:hypothetical protein
MYVCSPDTNERHDEMKADLRSVKGNCFCPSSGSVPFLYSLVYICTTFCFVPRFYYQEQKIQATKMQ